MKRWCCAALGISVLAACTPSESPSATPRATPEARFAPGEEKRPPFPVVPKVANLQPATTYFFAVRRNVTCGARGLEDFNPIRVTRRPGKSSVLLHMALSIGVDRWSSDTRKRSDPPPPWLRSVAVRGRVASIDFQAHVAREIHPHCGASIWFNEVIRTAFQFPNVDSARILFGGNCKMAPFEGDPRSCTGFKRDVFEEPRAWGPIPRVVRPHLPKEGKIVFYDADCDYPFPNYRVHEVSVAADEEAVLTAATNALLRYWYRRTPRLAARSSTWVDVHISDGIAVFDWQSLRHLGWASTTCGGVGFGQSLDRTALQFPAVDAVQHWYRGSCARFSAWAQGTGCNSVRLNALDQLERVGT